MVNCEVQVPDDTSSARSARDCLVMDLLVTEQVEDPHVDCAEKNTVVYGGGWFRSGCQGRLRPGLGGLWCTVELVSCKEMELLVPAEYWYLCLAHYGSDVLEQKASRQDIDKHSIVWMCETGLMCLNRRQVARTWTPCNHLDVVQDSSKDNSSMGLEVVW